MFSDLSLSLQTVATGVHLTALIPGLVCALAADGIALSTMVRPLSPGTKAALLDLHRFILVALALMWISGLTLIALKLAPGGTGLTPKLIVKVMIVAVLTLNAQAITRVALPHLQTLTHRAFGTLPTTTRITLGLIGGVSAAAWASALALGALDWMKPLGFDALALTLGPWAALIALSAIAVAWAAPLLHPWVPAPDLAGHGAAR